MSLQYLIDGYNLVHHPLFSQGRRKSADIRAALVTFIRSHRLTGSHKNRVTVVFDGWPPEGGFYRQAANEEIIFSRADSADNKIKKILQESSQPKNMIVVSDDRQVRDFSRLSGAMVIGTGEFFAPAQRLKSIINSDSLSPELTQQEMQQINRELSRLWLK
jgi:predicted RNA-binding protein with PIN domain